MSKGTKHTETVFVRTSDSECLLEFSPLHDSIDELGEKFRGAIVTVVDPNHSKVTRNIDPVARLYGLTKTEAHIAKMVLEGMESLDIAESRNVSLETVKTQIKTILRKTNSANRAELVKRMLIVLLPLRDK